MTAAAAKDRMSVAEFLAWRETQPKARYELFRGEVVTAMAPERARHGRSKANAWRAIADSIARAGLPCEAFVDSIGVSIDAETFYQPDVVVNCGEAVAPDALCAPAPLVIVEALSTTTQRVDTSEKLQDYFRLPGLAHYLVVDLSRRVVLHYRRSGDGPALKIAGEGDLVLDPPGFAVAVADLLD